MIGKTFKNAVLKEVFWAVSGDTSPDVWIEVRDRISLDVLDLTSIQTKERLVDQLKEDLDEA